MAFKIPPMRSRRPRRRSASQRVLRRGSAVSRQTSLDLVFVLDTGVGMARALHYMCGAFPEVVRELRRTKQKPRLGLICYKDHEVEGDPVSTHALSESLGTSISFLSDPELRIGEGSTQAAGALGCALGAARHMRWRPDARKALVVITDRPPYGGARESRVDCPHHADYRDEVDALRRAGVELSTISVGSVLATRRILEWMAAETRSIYLELPEVEESADLLLGATHRLCDDLSRFRATLKEFGHLTPSRLDILHRLSA